MSGHTFLWHDYETFGIQTRRDRPAQFAAIRTDAKLNEIGEPIMLYCQPAPDYLPDPQSCLLTGITPQHCLEHGVPEATFAATIEQALAQPGTIGVGYNTIRFDDEITRFMFWRNLIDPYAREWQNQCGRWDILDLVRTAHALRPQGVHWPKQEDGRPSFKLEHLSAANGLAHEAAHDALSDVRATIALARLIREKQPRLFDFALALHKKDRVAEEIGLHFQAEARRPFLHISGMFPTERGCLAIMCPLAQHPTNKNEIIAWDCAHDPLELLNLDAANMRTRLFTATDALPEGVTRLPIKTIHLNKSPMVISNLKTLTPEMAEQWGISIDTALTHANIMATTPALHTHLAPLWTEVFQRPAASMDAMMNVDVDEDLYGGFLGNNDRRQLNILRTLTPEKLATARLHFDDERLEECVFRYRARNFPTTLSEIEQQRWQEHCRQRLLHGANGARDLSSFFNEIDQLSEASEASNERGDAILGELYDYAESIAPVLK